MHNGSGPANTYTYINVVYSLVIVNKYELPSVSSVFFFRPLLRLSASLSSSFLLVFICSPGRAPPAPISCLVFIISPSVSWFPFTLPRPRCLSASLRGLLSVHLRTCSAFPVFLNANLPLLLSGLYSHHSLTHSLYLSLSLPFLFQVSSLTLMLPLSSSKSSIM